MEKYNNTDDTITLFGSLKYMRTYAIYISIIWFVLILGFYFIGIPVGIGSFPGVMYGA
jgi:p-aminobenzoyl-glutamate transporter AbgT